MSCIALVIERRRILGDICNRCEKIESIPVYIDDVSGESLGCADESFDQFTDVLVFHLSEIIRKKPSTGHYNYGFDFDVLESRNSKKRLYKIELHSACGKKDSFQNSVIG